MDRNNSCTHIHYIYTHFQPEAARGGGGLAEVGVWASEASRSRVANGSSKAARSAAERGRQGSGGAAPSGVQGRSPGGGLGGRSPPEKFSRF